MNTSQPDPRFPADSYIQSFCVPFDFPVYFTRNVFAVENPLLESVLDRLHESRRHRVLVWVDRGVADCQAQLIDHIKEYFHARAARLELCGPPALLPGGEAAKSSWELVRDVLWTIGNLHLDRHSFILAVGGGGVLDMVGFAAALAHRGLRLVRLPTTVLAQCDAGVGVKNGMNEHGMKNFIGTFAPPFAVLNDFSFLPTLADREWTGGLAEAFKVALIKDADLFRFLCGNAKRLRSRDLMVMETVVRRTAALHLEHTRTAGDPFEFGEARPLDFGHWAAHRLESLSNYSIGHGQAVALGIALDSFYAAHTGLLSTRDLDDILNTLTDCGLPVWHPLLEQRSAQGILEVLEGLEQFREHLGGVLTVTLPDGIGNKREVHQVGADLVERGLVYLKQFHTGRGENHAT